MHIRLNNQTSENNLGNSDQINEEQILNAR